MSIENGDMTIRRGDDPILVYNLETDLPDSMPSYYARSGYIHPLYTPSGKIITDGFPVGHAHQHGIFYAFVKNDFKGEFLDFWNQQKETGSVRHVDLIKKHASDEKAGFTALLEHYSLKHGVVLNETWTVEIILMGKEWVIDLTSSITNVSTDTLFVAEYHYGGLGIRGSATWNSADKEQFRQEALFLTSRDKNRQEANHTAAEWAAMYGEIDNRLAGVAVIPHRHNFRYPQKLRVHPEMPYFCYAPMVDGAFNLAPGENFISTYRIIPFDDQPNIEILNDQVKNFHHLRVKE